MEKDFYKLMNNSIYEKTCEKQLKRYDFSWMAHPEEFTKLLSKPQSQDLRLFNEFLVALNLKKVQITINKPFYVGFAVLELSKLHMYKYAHHLVTILVSFLFLGPNAATNLD